MGLTGTQRAPVLRWRESFQRELDDWVSEEVPVAREFNGISQAAMLATPCDLQDLALGFGISEGIFANAADLYECDVNEMSAGKTISMDVSVPRFEALKYRRHTLAGRTGCGLYGTKSLAQVFCPVPFISSNIHFRGKAIMCAMRSMRNKQKLNKLPRLNACCMPGAASMTRCKYCVKMSVDTMHLTSSSALWRVPG